MKPYIDSDSANQNSPNQLKAIFQPRLAGWKVTPTMLKVMSAVLENWLRGNTAEDIDHFRHRHRPRNTREIDELLSRMLVTTSGNGRYYELKFLGFCLLLANGSRVATKLRAQMDDLLRQAKAYLKKPPPNHSQPTTTLLAKLPEHCRPLLIPAIKLLSETSVGISLAETNTPYPNINFSDSVFRYASVTKLAWSHLQDYLGSASPYPSQGLAPIFIPFDLKRLQISSEVHASALKAVNSIAAHPDSAVSHARAAIEATLKHVLGSRSELLEKSLPRQAAEVRKLLRLEKEYADLGTRLVSVIETVGDIRNAFGDSHGKAPGERGATRSEAQLTVGIALLVCEYFLDRHESVRSMPK